MLHISLGDISALVLVYHWYQKHNVYGYLLSENNQRQKQLNFFFLDASLSQAVQPQ